eukprot:5375731-Amphidinium_carterae.2
MECGQTLHEAMLRIAIADHLKIATTTILNETPCWINNCFYIRAEETIRSVALRTNRRSGQYHGGMSLSRECIRDALCCVHTFQYTSSQLVLRVGREG